MTQRHGASQLITNEGSAVEGETNFLHVAQCEDVVLKLFQELRSVISCLILLDIWWCSDLVYKVLIGHLKGLSEVCDNALKPCMSFPGHSCPTGDGRKALLPPRDLSLLESFKDQGYFSPALTKIHTYDSLGIWSDSLGSGDRKQYLEARQDDSIACAVSVYGCKRADKPDEERWGWCCWGELSVWRAFDAVQPGRFVPLVV